MELVQYWRILWRRWWLVAALVAVVLIVSLITAAPPAPFYQASMRFAIGIEGEDAVSFRVVSGVLERLPGSLQQHPVLGVHDLGFPRCDTEEWGIESVCVRHDRTGIDEGRLCERLFIDTRCRQLILREGPDRLDALLQVTPELIERARAGSWNPDRHEGDRKSRDALAARGLRRAAQGGTSLEHLAAYLWK